MAHEHHGAFQARDNSFEPLNRGNVQVVSRFIEEQQVGVLRDGPCKKHATLLPAAQAVVQSVVRDARLSENRFGMGIVVAVFAAIPRRRTSDSDFSHHHVAYRPFDMRGDFLNHARNPEARPLDNFTRLRFHFASEDLQKSALAFPITAHQANPVARLDIKRNIV